MNKRKQSNGDDNTIARNNKARFDYFIEDRMEAGLVLQGWEVKSLRAGRIQLQDSYVLLKDQEAYLFGALISSLPTASTHIIPDTTRTRKLLLKRPEINRLIGAVDRKGYTLIPMSMYWKNGRAKVEIAVARGKQTHDKRATIKDREWEREKQRITRGRR